MSNEWNPPLDVSEAELKLLKLCRSQKLWSFFRHHRHEILDGEVRAALASMYRSGAKGGRPAVAPERLALAMLLQVGFGVADHEVPALTVADRRWQMVLDCVEAVEPAFSQGTLFTFRERAREHGLMHLLLNKTVALARSTKEFDHKRLRALFDSSPLTGAGRVEDTFNLLGHAIAQLVEFAAAAASKKPEELTAELQLTTVSASSIKAALDVDWREPEARVKALGALIEQFERLRRWLEEHFAQAQLEEPPMSEHIAVVERVIEQDTEPDPDSPGPDGKRRLRQGVKEDRLISLSDRDMRHGRKSTTKSFNGYKRHIAVDADIEGLVCAVHIVPANRPEHEAAKPLLESLEKRGFELMELHVDRGYIPATAIAERRNSNLKVITKPPTPVRGEHFGKDKFTIDFDAETVTCPTGATIPLQFGKSIAFSRVDCRPCPLRQQCTSGRNRQIKVHAQEQWFREMAVELSTPEGRAKRRARVPVEHALARVSAIQGNRARYKGIDKNHFDLERAAVLSNCFVLGRLWDNAA